MRSIHCRLSSYTCTTFTPLRSTSSLFLFFTFFFLMIRRPPTSTLFPTRRSSDLHRQPGDPAAGRRQHSAGRHRGDGGRSDRKSTRLNSSHVSISYAVFCLKKKKKQNPQQQFVDVNHGGRQADLPVFRPQTSDEHA